MGSASGAAGAAFMLNKFYFILFCFHPPADGKK